MLWTLAVVALAAPDDVDRIRARWSAVQEELAAERLVPLRIDANPSNRSWAAVGTFAHVLTCHRATPPEEPYPAPAPVLVSSEHTVAARQYSRTWLYDADGTVIFAHATGAEQPEWRVYWAGGVAVRVQKDAAVVAPSSAAGVVSALAAEGAAVQLSCASAARQSDGWDELPRE